MHSILRKIWEGGDILYPRTLDSSDVAGHRNQPFSIIHSSEDL
jgi:hypothetical protein